MKTDKIKRSTEEIVPIEATHPGVLIKEELDARGMKQKELAALIGIPSPVLSDVIKGKRSINADLAVLLQDAMDIPAEYWMRLQSSFDIDKAKISTKMAAKRMEIEIWNVISRYVPIKIFEKRGYLSNKITENINTIWNIFSVNSVEGLMSRFSEEPELVLYKKSERLQSDPVNMFGWKNLAKWLSVQYAELSPFDKNNEKSIIRELNDVFYHNKNTIQKVKTVLNKYGIKFIVLEKFDKTPIDGSSFWIGDNPTIVVTVRLRKLDNLAFSVMHELGHIFRHLSKDSADVLINVDGLQKDDIEEEANKFAHDALIPVDKWKDFMSLVSMINPYAVDGKIRAFSKINHINEAITFGLYTYAINYYSIRTNIDKSIN